MATLPVENLLPAVLTRSRSVAQRHVKARIFALTCAVVTWLGVLLLGVLLADTAVDSLGWVGSRLDRDPRMFMLVWQSDPGFEARAREINSGFMDKLDRKVERELKKTSEESAQVQAEEVNQARLDYLHAAYFKDAAVLEQFQLKPSAGQRLRVLGQIMGGFLGDLPSRYVTKAGIFTALIGSLWLMALTAAFAIPLGIAAAVYLEEYAARGRINRFIEINIANLAGVPSIVYGILGLALFVRGLALGRTALAGALTMTLLVLPVIIIAAREAIKAVPGSIRQGGFALGATRWQVTRDHVLPVALPGILTGVILAMSRAIGETAPMIMIGALSFVAFVPKSPLDDFTVLPIQIYNWVARPQGEFQHLAALGILVLLVVLLLMNAAAVVIRHRAEKRLKW